MRIVSLVPAATEALFALELGSQVVGVTHACDHPACGADAGPLVTDLRRRIESAAAGRPRIRGVFLEWLDPAVSGRSLDARPARAHGHRRSPGHVGATEPPGELGGDTRREARADGRPEGWWTRSSFSSMRRWEVRDD